MHVAAALVAQTIPLAGITVGQLDEEWRDLFVVTYIAVVGLLLSLIAGLDDLFNLTDIIGLSVEALQSG